ncbi:MAG: NADH-dependent [FeFe] hydrogenase, group A6 [Clostridia bacterium]
MEKVTLTIDGVSVTVDKGITVLEAAKAAKIEIPTLCFLKEINEVGDCRMCIVEVEGARGLVASCMYPVAEGLVVKTHTPKIIETRKAMLELILSNHNKNCLSCSRNLNCELQNLAMKYNIGDNIYEGEQTLPDIDKSSNCIQRDTSKCILCRRCVNVCKKVQGVDAIANMHRGFKTKVSIALGKNIAQSPCVGCGQCIVNCPTAALKETPYSSDLLKALQDPNITVIVQTAPSVRAALGEEFGMEAGTLVTGKMVAGLKLLGFDKVFDTNIGADITIVEEGTEFIDRIKHDGVFPMITSCSAGWVNYAEEFYPQLLPHLSSTKSPMQILGTLIKTYYAEKMKIEPSKIYSVAIMPCTAKKDEIERKQLEVNGMKVVDTVLTTRELARLMKQYNVDLNNMQDVDFDNPLGLSTGSGAIFGKTGGVMEAAIRTLSDLTNDVPIEKIDYEMKDEKGYIREATVNLGGADVKICTVQTLKAAEKVLKEIIDGTSPYQFIEIMACPGGCIMGGGQPIIRFNQDAEEIKKKRTASLNSIDENSKYRLCHKNPQVLEIYEDYLGKPNIGLSHKLLHTSFAQQEIYGE